MLINLLASKEKERMEINALTVVIGASESPSRYSNKAILALRNHNLPVMAIGKRPGMVADIEIQTGKPAAERSVDTITLYLSEENQEDMIDYILSLKPRRIIFNPGAENEHFATLARKKGVNIVEACTLVMLSTGQY